MSININHPTYILFLENVTNGITSNVTIDNYFSLPQDKKFKQQLLVFKLIKNLIKSRGTFVDNEIKTFIVILRDKNTEMENFELSAILKDILINFDLINEINKPLKKLPKLSVKTDTQD